MKTVITYGVFDLFHQGHINLLKRARALGDRLIVGVTTDAFTRERGKTEFVDSFAVRRENVRSCGYADIIIPEERFGQKEEDIRRYGADIFVVGNDWEGKFDYLKEYCEVVYLPRTPGISSTKLRKTHNIRIGMVGTGRQAERFVREASYLDRYMGISGVFSPDAEHVRAFCETCGLEAFTDLDSLIDASDAVYIASPHGDHYAQCLRALQKGRHVLCEKPLVMSRSEAEDLFRIADENGLVLCEGLKTAYCPGFNEVMAMARSGIIGEIHDIDSCFTRLTPEGLREWTDAEYGGSFTEFGSYTLLPVIRLMGTEGVDYRFFSSLSRNGTDSYTRFLASKGDVFASGKNGLGVKSEGQLIISGTRGYIIVRAPWWKTDHFEVHYEDPSRVESYDCEFLTEGLRYEINDFINKIYGNRTSDIKLSAQESIAIAAVMEAFLKGRNDR